MYYLRTKPATNAIQFTVDHERLKANADTAAQALATTAAASATSSTAEKKIALVSPLLPSSSPSKLIAIESTLSLTDTQPLPSSASSNSSTSSVTEEFVSEFASKIKFDTGLTETTKTEDGCLMCGS